MRLTVNFLHLLPLLALTALSGCFNLGRDAPIERYFVLGAAAPGAVSGADSSESRQAGLRIGLRQVELAEYLESPLIVVREGAHRIRYSEFNRWGGSPGNNVDRAVAAYLEALTPRGAVDIAPWSMHAKHDVLVQVHLLHLEGWAPVDPADLDGGALMQASWQIINPRDGAEMARGATKYEVEDWTVGDFDRLVELLDAGLWELSNDLAEALANTGHSP